ncbi:YggS family pyridoxal phosphate enzyme [bacterium J17]|nr:YggS family pyridoxal phosphate enzyme [bacterium J17]
MGDQAKTHSLALIPQRLKNVLGEIESAAIRVGRSVDGVQLLAVSKRVSAGKIIAAFDSGQMMFGENYVQESRDKIPLVKAGDRQGVRFDLIGPLQRNKVKYAVGLYDVIQTVDRPELAESIAAMAEKRGLVQRVYIQINVSEEDSKSGVMPEDAASLFASIKEYPSLCVEGLMSLGSFYDHDLPVEKIRKEFQAMKQLSELIESQYDYQSLELSMGTSQDYQIAVEEGATIVRLGAARKMLGSTLLGFSKVLKRRRRLKMASRYWHEGVKLLQDEIAVDNLFRQRTRSRRVVRKTKSGEEKTPDSKS